MPPFSCKSGMVDLCVNGGSCDLTMASTPVCKCPEGFVADTSLFHFANCTLPSNFYLVFFIFSSAVSLPVLILTAQQVQRSRSQARLVAVMLFLTVLFAWLYHFGLYYEDGCFVFALITLLISLASEGTTLSLLTLGLIDPVFNLKGNDRSVTVLKELLWGRKFFIGASAGFGPFLIVLPVLSRMGNVETYNNIVALFLFIACAIGLVYLAAIRYLTRKLVTEIGELAAASGNVSVSGNSSKTSLEALLARLSRLHKGASVAMLVVIIIVPIPVLYLTLGSLPYAWILSPVIAYSGCLVFAVTVLKFLRTEQKKETTGSSVVVGAMMVTSSPSVVNNGEHPVDPPEHL